MDRLSPNASDRIFIRRLLLAALALALLYFLYRVADLILLAFGAMLGAVLLSTVANWLAARTGMPRWIGLALATLLLVGFFVAIGWLFGAETIAQAGRLQQTLPRDWARLRAALEANPIGHMLTGSISVGAGGDKLAGLLLGAGWGATAIVANFVIILVGAVFFAAQPALYRRGLELMTPPAHRPLARAAMADVGRALKLWLLTQLVSMVMMGIMIGLGLWWSGVEAPVALGVLGGLSEFIPYVGPTLAMVPAIIVALAGTGSLWGVLGTYAVVRLVQANIITPLISQRVVSVPPGLYLFLILACGYAFGTFGMFFAGALSVTAYTLAIRLYSRETLGDPIAPPGS